MSRWVLAGNWTPRERQYAVAFSAASLAFGASFAMVATGAGLGPVTVLAMAALVFGGGAQFGALGVMLAGGAPAAAVAVGLALNSRFLLMGLSAGSRLRMGPIRRLLAAIVSIDASLLVAMSAPSGEDPDRSFWRVGLSVFVTWQLGTVAGLLLGGAIPAPETLGLDALIATVFIGLLAPLLSDSAARLAALTGGVVCVVTLPVLPPGMPVLVGAVVGSGIASAASGLRSVPGGAP